MPIPDKNKLVFALLSIDLERTSHFYGASLVNYLSLIYITY